MKKAAKSFTKNFTSKKSSKKNHLMKSSWNLGKTETMRVPSLLKPHLMEIARHIDNGGTADLVDQNEFILESKNIETILSQENRENNKSDILFSEVSKSSENTLSQKIIEKVIIILKHGITSKKQGGVYQSSNANVLKQEVIKVLVILEELVSDG